MKIKHWGLIFISGMIWLMSGISLFMKGLRLIIESVSFTGQSVLLSFMQGYFSNIRSAASALIALAIFIGFLKGRFVLKRSVWRVVERIISLPEPVKMYQIYSPKFYLLIGLMICMGVSLRFFGVSQDIRGAIDLAVGSALMNGAFLYFRSAMLVKSRAVKL